MPINQTESEVRNALTLLCEYEIRSVMTAGLMTKLWEEHDGEMAQEAKRLLEQYLSIQKFYYGDYYPLTSYRQAGRRRVHRGTQRAIF